MQFAINDGVWVRPVDLGAALSARSYSGDLATIVLEVADALLPENAGRWGVTAERCGRARETEADLRPGRDGRRHGLPGRLRLHRPRASFAGGRAEARIAAERGDALFRTGLAPWCAEIF